MARCSETAFFARIGVAITAAALSACSGASDEGDGPSAPTPTFATETLPPAGVEVKAASSPPPMPRHNYDERDGSNYFYVAAVSEEDRKKGIAAGNVIVFQYLGLDDDGKHVLASIDTDGSIMNRARCASPCRIIQRDYGKPIAYSPGSIIGAAFEDAFRGKLRVADWVIEMTKARYESAKPTAPAATVIAEPVNDQPDTEIAPDKDELSNPEPISSPDQNR